MKTRPFVKLTKLEKLRAALPVLLAARRLVILDAEEPLQAIALAGNCKIECEFAREAMRFVLWEPYLQSWQEHPLTTRGVITKAFDRAIKYAKKGGEPKSAGGGRVAARSVVRP